jgi:hypothetical protein
MLVCAIAKTIETIRQKTRDCLILNSEKWSDLNTYLQLTALQFFS